MDFAKDLFPKMLREGVILKGYVSPEYIKDAGTPKRLDKVELDLQNGKVERASLAYLQRAVFIDRDGTLNVENGYITNPEQLNLFSGVGESLAQLNKFEWRSILVTNQPVIARGDCTKEVLNEIHWKLESVIAESGSFLDKIYYCPHHPDKGFENEIKNLKLICSCRKPAIGMFEKAVADFNIDILNSWIIGDSTTDIAAAHKMGISSILVETGNAGLDDKYPYTPDYVLPDFKTAVNFIIDDYELLVNSYEVYIEEMKKNKHWFVGGLSKSGKSTFSAICKRELKKQGFNCIVISLDRWLIDVDKRAPSIINRYDLDAIIKLYLTIINSNQNLQVKLPYYSRKSRIRLEIDFFQDIKLEDIIIWEGIVAVELAKMLQKESNTFFIEIGEEIRKSRVLREYNLLGVVDYEFDKLYLSREQTEYNIISKGKFNSKYIIN
jgi:D,D-heptose 1,7-bisphosphate phosphatase